MPDTPVSYAFISKPDAARDVINAELLHAWLVGGLPTADSPYDSRELRVYVQQAREWLDAQVERKNKEILQADFVTRQKLEKESWFDDLNGRREGAVPDEYIQSFIVPVLRDVAREEQYLEVPAAFLNLRRYQNLPGEEGILSVSYIKLSDRRRYPQPIRLTAGMARALDVQPYGLMGQRGFWQEGTTVRLARDRGQPELDVQEVEVKGIVRGSRTTELPPPPLIQAAQDWEIQKYARELAMKRVREDKSNDNNSATP